jgi:hypothetical protein
MNSTNFSSPRVVINGPVKQIQFGKKVKLNYNVGNSKEIQKGK